jgi:hypothetical protein
MRNKYARNVFVTERITNYCLSGNCSFGKSSRRSLPRTRYGGRDPGFGGLHDKPGFRIGVRNDDMRKQDFQTDTNYP